MGAVTDHGEPGKPTSLHEEGQPDFSTTNHAKHANPESKNGKGNNHMQLCGTDAFLDSMDGIDRVDGVDNMDGMHRMDGKT
jgi:hypothetical protein